MSNEQGDDDANIPEPVSIMDPPPTSADEFLVLRSQCDALVAGENIDKAVALGILKLFHVAETMMRELRFSKDQELEKLRHEIAVIQMLHRNAEMLESLASCTTQLKAHREEDAQQMRDLSATVRALQSTVDQLAAGRRR